MLAVQSAMDALRHAGTNGSDRQSLLREPSAEDLDAAHQLVSSARGERKNPPSAPESQAGEPRDLSIRQQGSGSVPIESERAISESQEREVAGTFSQACRYVFRKPDIRKTLAPDCQNKYGGSLLGIC